MIDKTIDRIGKKKLFFIVLISILIIGILIAGAKEYYAMRFKVGDQGFKYVKTENRKIYFVDDEGQSLIAFAGALGSEITSTNQDVVIKYMNQTIKKTIDHDSDNPVKILLDDELIYEGDWKEDEANYYRVLMEEVIDKSIYFQNGLLTYKIFIFIFFGLIISVAIVYPEVLWFFQHMLFVKDGEPTEFYIITLRVTGVVLIFLLIRIAFL